MKKIVICLMAGIVMAACTPAEKPAETTESTVILPYTAPYSTSTQEVSDQDLLTVLNSYKAWETGDMAALRATLSDSVYLRGWDGTRVDGTADELMQRWSAARDTLSSVAIRMDAWVKTNFTGRNEDFISVWYRQIDTYKNGRVDTIFWHDVNMMANGKIKWCSQYRQEAPKK